MSIFSKAEKQTSRYMLCIYVRHFKEISELYIKNPSLKQFFQDKEAKAMSKVIMNAAPMYMDTFAQDIGTGIVWEAKKVLFYFPPAWYDIRNYVSSDGDEVNETQQGDKITGKSIPETFKNYIINHVNEKILPQTSLTEQEKEAFLEECGGSELKEVFAKRFMGYPCEKTKTIYFFALFPNIHSSFLPYTPNMATFSREDPLKLEQTLKKIRSYGDSIRDWKRTVARIQAQSNDWKNQKLCPHCGGKLGFFGRCKVCKQSSATPVKTPSAPVQPQVPEYKPLKNNANDFADDDSGPVPSITVSLGGNDWRVLDVQNGKALLLSDKIIKKRAYNAKFEEEDITWETCTLREYLNGEFYNKFDAAVKTLIAESRIENDDNQCYGTHGGNTTTDKIFLLSIEEVVKYFGDSGQLKNDPRDDIHDQYNSARIAKDENGAASWWWLRSPGGYANSPAYVRDDGSVRVLGSRVRNGRGGVRPAFWLNLES